MQFVLSDQPLDTKTVAQDTAIDANLPSTADVFYFLGEIDAVSPTFGAQNDVITFSVSMIPRGFLVGPYSY